MARSSGRDLKLQLGNTASPIVYTTVGTVREKSFTINKEPIDVTNDDDAGVRALLAKSGEKTIDLSVSGVTDSDALLAAALGSPEVLQNMRILLPSGGTIDGPFFIASMGNTGQYKEATTFEAEFQSAGPWTYTP